MTRKIVETQGIDRIIQILSSKGVKIRKGTFRVTIDLEKTPLGNSCWGHVDYLRKKGYLIITV